MKLGRLKSELLAEITNNILPFWSTIVLDGVNGGFYGRVDGDGMVHPQAEKGSILNARILWTFASAFRALGNPEYLKIATRAKEYLTRHFVDKEYGGVYWMVDCRGNMTNGKKQIYAQSFAVYGLSEYFRATKDELSLQAAVDIYHLIEKHGFDRNLRGYFEAFSREWGEREDLRLSERDANEKKTMNTHLHVLEAYTNLYRAWPDKGLKKQLRSLIEIFEDKIVNHRNFHLDLFFDENWTSKADIFSYGHDIEASWLLDEALRALGDDALTKRIQDVCLKIAAAACEGLMPDGGLIHEKDNSTGRIDWNRHWWPNSEALVGFLNAYELTGDGTFLDKALASWRFISSNLIDREKGEWFWSVDNNMKPNRADDKAGFWKCPYHNGRMCLEGIARAGGRGRYASSVSSAPR